MHNELINSGFVCVQSDKAVDIYNYLIGKDSVRYVRGEEGMFPPEMEIKFTKDELDEGQLRERVKLPLTGLDIYFSSIETNIAFKEELLKTDKDFGDANHLRIVYEGEIDENKISEIKKKIKELRLNKG